MKQNKYINHIIIIVLLLIFNSCSFDYDFERFIIKDVSMPCDILLYTSDTTIFPSNITIHIVGVINGECTFEIENGLNKYKTIKLRDTIDYIYRNEWYEPKIHLRYLPVTRTIGDSIVIKYELL